MTENTTEENASQHVSDPEQQLSVILDSMQNTIREITLKETLNFSTAQQSRLTAYQSIHEKLRTIFTRSDCPSGTDTAVFLQDIEKNFDELSQWIGALIYFPEGVPYKRIWEEWQNAYNAITADVPETVSIDIPSAYWSRSRTNSHIDAVYKFFGKIRLNIIFALYRLLNMFEDTSKRTEAPILKRSVHMKRFLAYDADIAIRRFLVEYRCRLLQEAAEQLHARHQMIDTLVANVLDMNKIKSLCSPAFNDWAASRDTVQSLLQHPPTIPVSDDSLPNQYSIHTDRFIKNLVDTTLNRWSVAGTLLFSNRAYSTNALKKANDALTQHLDLQLSTWRAHFRGELADWKKDIELAVLQLRIMMSCKDTLAGLSQNISERLQPHFTHLKQLVDTFANTFNSDLKQSQNLTGSVFRSDSIQLLKTVRNEIVPKLVADFNQSNPSMWFEKYIYRIGNAIEQLSATHVIFQKRDVSGLLPASKIVDIPLKSLIQEDIFHQYKLDFERFSKTIRDRFAQIRERTEEIEQIIEFNLNATSILIAHPIAADGTIHPVHQSAQEAFARTLTQIDTLSQGLNQILAEIETTLPEKASALIIQIQRLADNENIITLKMHVTETKSREKIRQLGKRWWRKTRAYLDGGLSWANKGRLKLRNSYLSLRKITGLSASSEQTELELTLFLSETQKRIARLPFIYQSLFQFDPLSDNRLFTGRETETSRFRSDLENWRKGHDIAIALIGEKGSGKTSFINMLEMLMEREQPITKVELNETVMDQEQLIRRLAEAFNIEQITTWDDLTTVITSQEKRGICVVENIHNTFIRTVDGFATLEEFLLFISNTMNTIFWTVSCTWYAWHYLDKLIAISRYFHTIISLRALSRQEMSDIILKRHRLSGYELVFEHPAPVNKNRKFKKLATEDARQAYLQKQFFDRLTEHSAGNIRVAMLFWLSAIKQTRENKLIVSTEHDVVTTFLNQLPADELFSLAAVIQHDSINVTYFARIFTLTPTESLRSLNRLRSRGILIQTGDSYAIHHFLYRPIVRMLSAKNILH